MSSPCRARALTLLLLAVLLASPAMAGPLRVCSEPDNLPFSDSSGGGFEIATAKLLAEELGRPLEIVYVAQRTPDFLRTTINAGACDLLMGVPARFGRLATTAPWYRSHYVAISRYRDAIDVGSLADPRLRGLAIGVAGRGTPPALALARHGLVDNIRAYSVFDAARLVEDVGHGRLDLALVWGPFAGWLASRSDEPLALAPLDGQDPPLAFDIAIGVRKGDQALRSALDDALARRRNDIAEILHDWRVPVGE